MNKKNIETLNFIQDLCWLLDSKKELNFSEVANLVNDLKNTNNKVEEKVNKLADDIVGILPRILVDTTLFKTNMSLQQFADEVLNIEIKNWEKRSRNEMIGVIICQIQESDKKLKGVSAYLLEHILENKEEFAKIQNAKENEKNQFKWNDAIHQIVGNDNE